MSLDMGYVHLASLGLNSFDQTLTATLYGPEVNVTVSGQLGSVHYDTSVVYVPLFWYSINQEIQFSPLIAGKGSHEHTGTGNPYIIADLGLSFSRSATILKYLGIRGHYEFQRFQFDQLVPTKEAATSTYVWALDSSLIESHTLTIEGSLVLPLFQQGCLQLGSGYRNVWTRDEQGNQGYQGRVVYQIAYSFSGL